MAQRTPKYYIEKGQEKQEREKREDDPMSPLFKPFAERTEIDRARFYARIGKRKNASKFYAELE